MSSYYINVRRAEERQTRKGGRERGGFTTKTGKGVKLSPEREKREAGRRTGSA